MADEQRPGLSDAARRGLRRAGAHLVKAAIEVVAGLGAFIEELQSARDDKDDDETTGGRQRVDLD